jgi:hypothetical protein
LRLANEIRSARAKLKKDLASGKIEPAKILAQPPECGADGESARRDRGAPEDGSVTAGRILANCGIAHSKTLGGLTERQRTELLNRFRRDRNDKVIRRGAACGSALFREWCAARSGGDSHATCRSLTPQGRAPQAPRGPEPDRIKPGLVRVPLGWSGG